ncbi:MAG: recombinase family protein [Acutalibacteraceae bacterium]
MSLANDYKSISDRVTVIAATTGNKTDKIRVAAYCRVSTDKTDQVNSFITQMRYYTDYIKSNPKMILIDIYADEGISGTLMDKRDEFKRLLKDCKNRKIDRVLVKSVRGCKKFVGVYRSGKRIKILRISVFFENDKIDTENMNSEIFFT